MPIQFKGKDGSDKTVPLGGSLKTPLVCPLTAGLRRRLVSPKTALATSRRRPLLELWLQRPLKSPLILRMDTALELPELAVAVARPKGRLRLD